MKPFFSILMAVYNQEQYLSEAIDSVINQDFKDWELLIIDDGSKDNSLNLIKEYALKYPQIKILFHKNNINRGLANTLKLGLNHVTGQWIGFIEGDDVWAPNHLSQKATAIKSHDNVKVFYNKVEPFGINDSSVFSKKEYIAHISSVCPASTVFDGFELMKSFNLIPTFSCATIKLDLLRKLNFNSPIKPWLDWWLWSQASFHTSFFRIDESLTRWRIHDQSYNARYTHGLDVHKSMKLQSRLCQFLLLLFNGPFAFYRKSCKK